MPKIAYVPRKFDPKTLAVIEQANAIIDAYAAQGFDLTLRQLYYQFVARGLIPNRDSEYKRLGSIVNDARLAGLIDWERITDRTRNLRALANWESPADRVRAAASTYRLDHWQNQDYRPEVWIEKDALVGVIQGICEELDVPYFSCRGYTSQSEMWAAAQRLEGYEADGQTPLIIHLGDHDPSGIDMSRDILDRLQLFLGGNVEFKRIALNMDQVQEYNPPPNPAKTTDSRFVGYIAIHGPESWELDALEPQVLADLIRDTIEEIRDEDAYDELMERERDERALLRRAGTRWADVATYLGNGASNA
jgi:hypothetical protein